MPERKKQAGGRKEALPAAVGSSGLGGSQQRETPLTPKDAEYYHYSELLRGFFEKLTRWQEIYAIYGGLPYHGFSVFRSESGTTIRPGTSMEMNDPPEKILQIYREIYSDHPEAEMFGERILMRPGPAGNEIFIDPVDKKPLEGVDITVDMYRDVLSNEPIRSLQIHTGRRDRPGGYTVSRRASYIFRGDTLKVANKDRSSDIILTDAMAVSLINTIDALIPVPPGPVPQTEQKTTNERKMPRLLRLLSVPIRRRQAGR